MSGNPAPEKVAALAAALHVTDIASILFAGDEEDHVRDADAILKELRAAGYDVARIEEGERPELLAQLRRRLADLPEWTGHPAASVRRKDVDDLLLGVFEERRAALAASDEAAK